jgi:hypothetical protein
MTDPCSQGAVCQWAPYDHSPVSGRQLLWLGTLLVAGVGGRVLCTDVVALAWSLGTIVMAPTSVPCGLQSHGTHGTMVGTLGPTPGLRAPTTVAVWVPLWLPCIPCTDVVALSFQFFLSHRILFSTLIR